MFYFIAILLLALAATSYMLYKSHMQNTIQKTEVIDASLKEKQSNQQEDANKLKEEIKDIKPKETPDLKPDEVEDYWKNKK